MGDASSPQGVGGLGRRLRAGLVDSGRLPLLGAALTALVALVNLASTLTPNIRWRGHLLLQLEGVGAIRVFHAISLPVGTALLLTAPYLFKRRRRALHVAVGILVLEGFVNLFKGLDFEECLAGWLLAGGLLAIRDGFNVVGAPLTLRSAVWRVPLLCVVGLALVTIVDWADHRHAHLLSVLRESGALLRGDKQGPLTFETHHASLLHHGFSFAWVPLGTHLLEGAILVAIAYVIFRPLAAPRTPPGWRTRQLAAEVVRAHGSDTLSFFKLREDNHFYFSEDGRAFVGYQVDSRVLLVSGDPVGPPEQFPALIEGVRAFARERGLRFGVLAAGAALREMYAAMGLATMYIGDEALVDIESFSLEGRAIRKVRQSVNRLKKNGYSAELRSLAELDEAALAEVEEVLVLGRQGRPEMGFSMGMDSIRGANDRDTLFLLARDEDNRVRAFLHFVPCYGRPAASLSLMRRDPGTPNGLMEFLIVTGIEQLKARGIKEMSLNFATGARWIHEPANPLERLAGRAAVQLDRWLQLESLYRFNAKFFPRWEPRYLVYEGSFGLARTGLAAMRAEGQVPALRIGRASRGRDASA